MGAGRFTSGGKCCLWNCIWLELLAWLLLLHWVCEVETKKSLVSDPIPVLHESYRPGDVLIGGMLSLINCYFPEFSFKEYPWEEFSVRLRMVTKFYQHILSLDFAVKEVNQNPAILPNVTLGYLVHDSYKNAQMTFRTTMNLLFKTRRFVCNYECGTPQKLIAVIGALAFDTSVHMAELLNPYKIPQLTYGSFASSKEMVALPPFYRMVPAENHQYLGMIGLLKHFGWTWIGLFVVEGDHGELFLQTMETLFITHGICADFTRRIPGQGFVLSPGEHIRLAHAMSELIYFRKSRVLIIYGETHTLMYIWFFTYHKEDTSNEQTMLVGKVWIITAQIDFVLASINRNSDLRAFHGAIAFSIHSHTLPGFQEALQMLKPDWEQADAFLEQFWEEAFDCVAPDPRVPYKVVGSCTGEERLESLLGQFFEMQMTGHSYSIYSAVYAMAHALHTLLSWRSSHRARAHGKAAEHRDLQPWQLHQFLQGISFNNSAGERIAINDDGEIEGGFDVINFITFPNKSYLKVKVGLVIPEAFEGTRFIIDEDKIIWHRSFNQIAPHSICTDSCPVGHEKRKREGGKTCCYDCKACPEGEISNQTDSEVCYECADDHYPSRKQDSCIPKVISFLSYEEPLGMSLASAALSFSLITILVLQTFMRHRDTPIVKANNRGLTYTLLVSLLFCFLSSLLFLGKPSKLTCLLQQPMFGVIFSVAVSCVLAKTITVVVAFMATKPGSSMRKWVGKRLATSIVLSCCLVQAGICIVWVGTSPPFPGLDTKSVIHEISAKCNAGSALMFCLVLGYMGLLSIICFLVAFFARKLPDSFNEAKFISFSMLMFCSVWLSFIPTYMSTKGKYVVAVEIFSILASSAGLLGCIFTPKCYLILFRPEMNSREHLIRRK